MKEIFVIISWYHEFIKMEIKSQRSQLKVVYPIKEIAITLSPSFPPHYLISVQFAQRPLRVLGNAVSNNFREDT